MRGFSGFRLGQLPTTSDRSRDLICYPSHASAGKTIRGFWGSFRTKGDPVFASKGISPKPKLCSHRFLCARSSRISASSPALFQPHRNPKVRRIRRGGADCHGGGQSKVREQGQGGGLIPIGRKPPIPPIKTRLFLYFMPSNLYRVASIWTELARLGYRWAPRAPCAP